MTDADLRAAAADTPVPDMGAAAHTELPGGLSRATVAVVTTAGLHHPDEDGFADRADESFRTLDGRLDGLRLGHLSQSVDRSAFLQDPNVILPLDRLRELADLGEIAGVADTHLAFMGAVRGNLDTIRCDSGPRAAAALRTAGADAVLLTPV